MLNSIMTHISRYIKRKKWRRKNTHNATFMGTDFDLDSVSAGNESYGLLNVINHNRGQKLIIGNYVSIAPNVTFVLNGEHSINHISTYPFKTHILHTVPYEALSKGDIIVDDDVWIGVGVTIMSGVHIHQGAIIAAGAVVCKDVGAYEIAGGIPAKVIKRRFDNATIEQLIKIDYSKVNREMIQEHIDILYKDDFEESDLNWLPKK